MTAICLSMITSQPVVAADTAQDGVTVSYTTDQDNYNEDETITATLLVTNTNENIISDLELNYVTPSGYYIVDEESSTQSISSLPAGDSVEFILAFATENTLAEATVVPGTADHSNVAIYIMIFIGIGTLLIINIDTIRKGKRIFCILIGLTILTTFSPALNTNAQYVQDELTIEHIVIVDGSELSLFATISYQLDWEEDDLLADDSMTEDFTTDDSATDDSFTDDSTTTDSDGDGLSDDIEEAVTFTDPLLADTDGNGINDGEEDFDEDGFSNLEEISLGTNCWMEDSDLDGLTDKEEIEQYQTNPTISDTDGDGMSDGNEIKYDTNPNHSDSNGNGIIDGEEQYDAIITVGSSEADENVQLYVSMSLSGANLDTVSVSNVGLGNPYLELIETMPSYMGMPYSASSSEAFNTATIVFQFNSGFKSDASFDPVIYSFNSDTKLLEKVPNQVIDWDSCTVSAEVTSFTTYIIVDASKIVTDTTPTNTDSTTTDTVDKTTDTDEDGIPDYYENLGVTINGITYTTDYLDADTDGDSLLDGEEVQVIDGSFVMITNPLKADSDNDGIDDGDDPEPMCYSITDYTLALAAGFSYLNVSSEIGNTIGSITSLETEAYTAELITFDDLSAFQILWGNDSSSVSIAEYFDHGYGSIAIKISRPGENDAIIYAIRGSDFDVDFDVDFVTDGLTDVALALGLDTRQSALAFIEYKILANQYPNCDIYITGHSLGGRLVQDVVYNVYTSNSESSITEQIKTPEHAATFNALGYNFVQYLELSTNKLTTTLKIENVLFNYYNTDDLIGEGLGNSNLFKRLGTEAGDFVAIDQNGDEIARSFPDLEYEPGNFHGISTFYEQEGLKYPASDIY